VKKTKNPQLERAIRRLERAARLEISRDWTMGGAVPGMRIEQERFIQGLREAITIVKGFR
jgi:hypothetical protein